MKKGIVIGVFVLCTLAGSMALSATWNYSFSISGSLLMHPAQYSGIFTSGGDGTFEYTLDDAGWPDPADPVARFDYIWATYFAPNYNNSTPGAEKWVGTIKGRFSMVVTAAPPGYTGTCQGGITAKYTVRDMNANGELDGDEKTNWNNMLDGVLSKLCADPSTGEMVCKQGYGSLSSHFFGFPTPPALNTLDGTGRLSLSVCASELESGSWGSIKSLYR